MENNENREAAYIGCAFSFIGVMVAFIALLIIEFLK